MNIKYLAVAAAVALAAPAHAEAIATGYTIPKATQANPSSFGTSTFSLTGGVYNVVLSAFSTFLPKGTGNSLFSVSLYKGIDDDSLKDWTDVVTTAAKPLNDFFSGTMTLGAGEYTLVYAGKSAKGPTTISASFNSVTAVPGPEAGAGLGALAMGGIALYLKRRRKDEALAV